MSRSTQHDITITVRFDRPVSLADAVRLVRAQFRGQRLTPPAVVLGTDVPETFTIPKARGAKQ